VLWFGVALVAAIAIAAFLLTRGHAHADA